MMILKDDGTRIASQIECVRSVICMMRGLMFRRNIPDDYAMVFVFPKPKRVSVHALFMWFPIDVIFLNSDKRIIDITRLDPWIGYRCVKDVSYMLETNSGTSDRCGLVVGTKLVFDTVATSINDHA